MRTPAYLTGVTERRNFGSPKDADIPKAELPKSMGAKYLEGWAEYCGENSASWARRATQKIEQGKADLSAYCDDQAAEQATLAARFGYLVIGR